MHDFLLAKEIVDEILRIIEEKKIKNIETVFLEIGGASIPHNHQHDHRHMHDEHFDELNMDNVRFGIESIARDTVLKNTKFIIKKTQGANWKISSLKTQE